MKRVLIVLATAAAALFACAPEEITVATIPAEPDGGHPNPRPPRRCSTNDDCPSDDFCDKHACGDVAGECDHRPTLCGSDGPPVCGCDGVTYFNDCLRRAFGVAVAGPGECIDTARVCNGPGAGDCPIGTFCARLLPPGAPCAPLPPPGRCWALPGECPATPSGDRWVSCGPPPKLCLDTCNAIRTNAPMTRAGACP